MKLFPAGFIALFALLQAFPIAGQTPTASFTASSGCLQENLSITNTSSNADAFTWDFCADDFSTLKFSGSLASVNGLTYGTALKMVVDNGQWYGFALAWYTDRLLRFDFGSSPLNSPTITNLGNPSGTLSFPESIQLVKQNGSWFGFITNIDVGVGITMLDFGSSLTNTPSISNLGNFGSGDRIFDTRIVRQGTDYFLVFAKVTTGVVVCVNFRNSFYNATAGFVYANTIAGPSLANCIDVAWNGSSWKGLITSYRTNEIYQVDFGADLANAPVVETAYASVVSSPNRIKLLKQADEFFAIVSSDNTGDIRILNFKNINVANPPTTLSYAAFTGILGIESFRYQGMSVIMGVGPSSTLSQLLFESSCGATSTYVTSSNPSGVGYGTAGIKKIELTATNTSSGLSDQNGTSVTISTSTAPDISFTTQNVCANSVVNFNGANSSGNLTSSSWDFGDSGTASGLTASHTFSAAATYNVRLTVTASNGCSNRALQSVGIFNTPVAAFNLPAASPVCTNQNYVFANTSTFDIGSPISWQWSVNGSNVATTQDLTYLIATTIGQTVKLVASLPGCSTQATHGIATVLTGPAVSFTSANQGCLNADLTFNNTTAGTITGLTWAFGDGNTSSQPGPFNYQFHTAAVYNVTLTTTNAAGCQNSAVKSIPVYSIPQPDFVLEKPPFACANFPAQFDNNTSPLSDSNITTWAWDFGDAGSADVSNQKNPAYTYANAGIYQVTLSATSNFGCSASIQKNDTIRTSPIAAFSNTAACVNQTTQFTDMSQGAIATLQWNIQGNNVPGQNLAYMFKSPGTFPVTLTATGANNCKNQLTKNVVVPPVPTVDFTITSPCANNPTTFQEVNPVGADPTVAWNWTFGSTGGIGSPINFTFSAPGGYSVTMSTTRQSGCVYSTTKNINIFTGPVANFTPSVRAGGAPLAVTFNNNSSGADSVLWQFGDGAHTTSTTVSPQFTYTQLGQYKSVLTAVNRQLGCADTTSAWISVVVPHVDLAMASLSLLSDPATQSAKPVVTILNSGNIPFSNPVVVIDLGGNALIRESVSGELQPGEQIQAVLNLEILPESVPYVCVEVVDDGDVDSDNNQQCVTLTGDDIAMLPFPNPATSQVNFSWVSANGESVTVTVLKSSGQIVLEQTFDDVRVGTNQFTINTSFLAGGLYLIQFTGAKVKRAYRVMVAN